MSLLSKQRRKFTDFQLLSSTWWVSMVIWSAGYKGSAEVAQPQPQPRSAWHVQTNFIAGIGEISEEFSLYLEHVLQYVIDCALFLNPCSWLWPSDVISPEHVSIWDLLLRKFKTIECYPLLLPLFQREFKPWKTSTVTRNAEWTKRSLQCIPKGQVVWS